MTSRWDERDVPALDGRTAVVTGANSGLGLEAAIVLASKGADVVMACRNVEKAEQAAARVRETAAGAVEILPLDLASLKSVAAAADQFSTGHTRLDLLVNNAGLMAIDRARTEDGFEMQFGVNHLGHFALTAALMPVLLSTPASRVVNVSSFGHRMAQFDADDLMFERRRYDRWRPYFQSKVANMLFTKELSRRLADADAATAALAAHPGGSYTDLGFEGTGLTNILIRPGARFMQSARMGSLPIVRAATDPAARNGQFYGPQWMFRGYPQLETPSSTARSEANARRLWDASEQLTGITFDIPHAA